jgi:general secretion pathway protein G
MKSKHQQRRRAGFTLIEIMVVVLILGLLIGMVGPNIWNALFSSQTKIAGNQIQALHSALDQYKMFGPTSRYPESLEDLTEPNEGTGEPFLKLIPLDPWKNEYEYDRDGPDGKPFITCLGADGEPGGENENADITTETVMEQR